MCNHVWSKYIKEGGSGGRYHQRHAIAGGEHRRHMAGMPNGIASTAYIAWEVWCFQGKMLPFLINVCTVGGADGQKKSYIYYTFQFHFHSSTFQFQFQTQT